MILGENYTKLEIFIQHLMVVEQSETGFDIDL